MINFGKMVVEGFTSIEDEVFDWGIRGLNIIQAPNGYGKTKFVNALVWGLFGKTLSGSVEPWAHTRSSSYRGTKVSIEINVNGENCRVIRYKDYGKFKNSLILEIGGKEKKGDKNEVKEEIVNLIGYTYELFINSIIFGQKVKRIISETGPNKKKVFDDAFQIAFIPKAKKLADEKLGEYRREGLKQENKVSVLEEKIKGIEKVLETEQRNLDSFELDKQEEIKRIKGLANLQKKVIKKLKNKYPNLENCIEGYKFEIEKFSLDNWSTEELKAKEKELTKLEMTLDREKEKALDLVEEIKSLRSYIKQVPEKCSNCNKPYTEEEKQQEINSTKIHIEDKENEYVKLIDNIGILKGQIKSVDGEIASAIKLQEDIDFNKNKIEELEAIFEEISEYQDKVRGYKLDIKRIKEKVFINRIESLTLELTGLRSSLKNESRKLRKVNSDIKTYEWVIKDPLSNSGLKAFIFNWMLDDINDRLEYYAKYVGLQVAFTIDMKSANKDLKTFVFKGEEPVPYEDLSGGQQQGVDLVTAFAIHDVVSDTKSCSLLIMDEVFESLDRDNIEIVSELIQEKALHKCLYLVTHRPEFNPTNANTIFIQYQDGITSVA